MAINTITLNNPSSCTAASNEIIKKTQDGMRESNKILIQELVYDLEEKSIPIVIGVEGEVKHLRKFHENEINELSAEIKKNGYDLTDFCITKSDEDKYLNPDHNPVVVVIYKKTWKSKEYKTSSFTVEFSSDLNNKFFS